ncbi:NADP-dependent phosphogluconate dehydrogenase [Psychrobium sp. 1_MG-2023]|uniref:NADP-dependent phosphogluconate dehydrogenase n=1 Tax=Psychrobium sp. 1_MG-2023 TaxID=3062624 RepID=UPI000C327223|nr:NADP-dependent phosphogluconate dehydrogenase [Psychrobium sp. 1_MG-2023]MDP2561579.1 NADP-dependent phosphogluconate dehydrogenase [Psychrobium sp. 1_MG-2023]PKF55039.1 phosphogluconate dehydrogenase (NADP(+)-dependent, decarboxylating) [Alteromonadales bacterium alter-6D02]
MTEQTPLCDIGFIGLGVMGKNIALNLADNGYKIAAFDLDHQKVDEIIAQDKIERKEQDPRIVACSSYTELLSKLTAPHLIILSVPAGAPVDDVCHKLIDAGICADDIIVDTGNSLWTDTIEREKQYHGKFIFFTTAVSGGEVGARFGPSLMPSGDPYAWARIEPIWHAISAKVCPETGKALERTSIDQPLPQGEPCATYIGPAGSGHYVKMVHNGIEYADMQLICEAYHVMRESLSMTPKQIASVFKTWNKGVLNSYLMEISAEVLEQDDPETGKPLVDIILDKAGQKGTGLWTAVSALEVGSPAATIAQSVFARSLSTLKHARIRAAKLLEGPEPQVVSEEQRLQSIEQLHDALYCSKIVAYAQGFQLIKLAARQQKWPLDFGGIAKIWRAGCIIRAAFLQKITDAYDRDDELGNLLLDSYFSGEVAKYQHNWRQAIASATLNGIPCGGFSSALAYYDSYRTETLPANLLQGQRDYFGAHTFERIDQPAGKKFHVKWSEPGRPLVKID